MKQSKLLLAILTFFCFNTGMVNNTMAEEGESLILNLKYFMYNNKLPYIRVETRKKVDRKFEAVKGITVDLFLDSKTDSNRIQKITTDNSGNATVLIPPKLKEIWDASPKHIFIGVSGATKTYEETETEIEIIQAKLEVDTLFDEEIRSITATLMEKSADGWIPVAEADLKIGVKRLGGILSAGSDESYATDEEGNAIAEFEKNNLPGDKKGELTLIASLQDNDLYGNLVTEIKAPWGTGLKAEEFNERALWATRQNAPIWLLILANSIIILVWGVIIYLFIQIIKIKKLGNESV